MEFQQLILIYLSSNNMVTLKQALQSKTVWSGLLKILAGISLIATGEAVWSQQVPEILLTVWGVVDIFIRTKTTEPLGAK